MPKTKTKKSTKKGTAPEIYIQVKSLGRVFKGEGESFDEALGKIKIPNGSKVLCVMTVTANGITKERVLNASQAKHIFGNGSPTLRQIILKGVRQRFL